MRRTLTLAAALVTLGLPALASAQINFPKDLYYLAFGDSVAAGEGAMPVTNGYAYQLYEQGTFGKKQQMEFANGAIRGARSWELRVAGGTSALCRASQAPNSRHDYGGGERLPARRSRHH